MTAAEHADRASDLLALVEGERAEGQSPGMYLRDTLALAHAHAQTAIALSFTNALPAVQVAPAGMEAPATVWVAVQGCYDDQRIVGVYETAEAGIAAHPVVDPEPASLRWGGEPWQEVADGVWENGLMHREAITLSRHEVAPTQANSQISANLSDGPAGANAQASSLLLTDACTIYEGGLQDPGALRLYEAERREPIGVVRLDGTVLIPPGAPVILFADVPVHLHLEAGVTIAPIRVAPMSTGPELAA